MNATRIEYKKRLNEVSVYFETIQFIDSGICSISCTNIHGEKEEKQIDPELAKILKANAYLILYNLIESTIRGSIDAILNSITNNRLTFKHLSEKLKKIIINNKIKNLNDINKLQRNITELSEQILNNELIVIDSDSINISGNIDAQKVRYIAKKLGYDEPKNGHCLLNIKEKRNQLAHGLYTFSDIGRDLSSSDLMRYKSEVVSFIDNVLDNVENYIKNKGFQTD